MKSEAIVHEHPTHCLNCGGAVKASFCQYCGQETVLHVPSAREFLHEFIGHYVALEGKLWKSLGLLLFRPGRLTREYIEGRRVRYVLPLRLYLSFSLVFFALLKYSGQDLSNINLNLDFGKARTEVHAEDKEAQARKEEGAKALALIKDNPEVRGLLPAVSPALVEKVRKVKGEMSWEEMWHKSQAMFFGYVPYAVFALMPVFALYLKVLYLGSGRRYGEHLLFALHTNGFAFLILSLLFVIPHGIPLLRQGLLLWLVFYLPTAMRKVYGGTRRATALRWIVLMTLHMISMLLAIFGTVALGMSMAA